MRGEGGGGDRERNKRMLVILTWSAVFVTMALGVLGVAVWLWLRPKMNRAASGDGRTPVAEAVATHIVSRFESPSEKEALDFVKRAISIRDPSKVTAFFHPGSAKPEEVIDFLRVKAEEGRVEGFTWLSSMDANGLLIDGVLVKTTVGNRLLNRLALLTPDEEGVWKIDFDAFARTVEPSWNELLEKNAGVGLVRVIVAADSYYNGPFRDDTQWICYGMVSPDTEKILLGYCRKGTPQAKAMKRIVSDERSVVGSRSAKRATLEIRRVEGAEPRQFEISRVMAEDWVMSATPFDGKFR